MMWYKCRKSLWSIPHFWLNSQRLCGKPQRSDFRGSQAPLAPLGGAAASRPLSSVDPTPLPPLSSGDSGSVTSQYTRTHTHSQQSIYFRRWYLLYIKPFFFTTTARTDSNGCHNKVFFSFLFSFISVIWPHINWATITCNLFYEVIWLFISLIFDLHLILHPVCFETELFRTRLTSFFINESIIWNELSISHLWFFFPPYILMPHHM